MPRPAPEIRGLVSKSLKHISIVSAATMVSRVLGLGRDSLTAAVFGTSALGSAFYTAFTLPNLFRRLLGEGALTAAFVPTLNEELSRRREAGAFALLSQVTSWLLLATTAVVGLSMIALAALPALLSRVGPLPAEPETVQRWLQAAHLSVWLFPYLIVVCLAAAFSAALQTLQRFLEPALSPIWLNCAMIGLLGGAVYLQPEAADTVHMQWLCYGVLLGGVLQMVVPAVTLMRLGWRPRFDLQLSDQVRAIARLMAPTVFGSAIYLVNMAVSRLVGLSLDDASAALLNLATRLMELPIGVFAVAVTTVVFPLISRHAAQGDWDGMADAYRRGMRLILLINIPAAIGLTLLASPVIRVLFQRGAFSASDTAAMAPVLALYALGLPFVSFVSLALRAFYAEKDTTTPVRAALISFLVNLGLSLACMDRLGTLGLALAGNVAIVVQAAYLQSKLSRHRKALAFSHLLGDVVKITLASVIMGSVVLGWTFGWHRYASDTAIHDAIEVGVGITFAVPLYAALLWALRMQGQDEVLAWIRVRFRGKKA